MIPAVPLLQIGIVRKSILTVSTRNHDDVVQANAANCPFDKEDKPTFAFKTCLINGIADTKIERRIFKSKAAV